MLKTYQVIDTYYEICLRLHFFNKLKSIITIYSLVDKYINFS